MTLPKVTIIVPCYNHELYLEQCIDSIMNQTYANCELFVINDGSKDQSLQVLERLKLKFNFTLIDQENKGLLNTLNSSLLTLPLGKYVCLLASDDVMPLNRIELQVAEMEKAPESAISFGNYTEIDSEGEVLEEIKLFPPKKNFFEEMLLSNYIPAPTVMVKSQVFKEVGLYDLDYKIEDWYMWLKILSKHPKPCYINENLAFYRLHSSNFHRNIDLITTESIKILDQYKESQNYEMAISIVKAKHVIKLLLASPKVGMGMLWKNFSLKLAGNLAYCLISLKGPFRKKKFDYFNW